MENRKWQLYFIAGTKDVGEKDLLDVLTSALKGGITAFQLREQGEDALQGEDLKRLAEQCLTLCKAYQVPFIINQHVDLALAIGADGVHIGQEDGAVADIRTKIGTDKILGVSTHTKAEALKASDEGANYIGVEPIYATTSKKDAVEPVGLELVREVVRELPGRSIVGVGGISERKVGAVIREGASGVAVIAAIAGANHIEEATRAVKGRIMLALTGVEM